MLVCETCIHRGMCEDKYTMTPQYACINYNSGKYLIIEELEKIKEELKDYCVWCDDVQYKSTNGVMLIIDNHIKELKGENNDLS